MATEPDGDFVVAGHSGQSYQGQDGSVTGVFARRFSSAGAPLASEFQVNTFTDQGQDFPSVAASASGNFVVAWQSKYQDGSVYGVFAQRFAASLELDIDGNGLTQPLTDCLLVLRFLFGFTGATLTTRRRHHRRHRPRCTRCDAAMIEPYLNTSPCEICRRLDAV